MRFRPCIDLHQGKVKQIVGATLTDEDRPITHFTADRPPSYFARLYRRDGLTGGHVIMLGPGNEQAAAEALSAYPGGLQVGGGIAPGNAVDWLERGASQVIVTSYIFRHGRFHQDRLERLAEAVGPHSLVVDLSCARIEGQYVVMTDRWQRPTRFTLTRTSLESLAEYCCEFLVHATQVEGRQQGIDADLVELLGDITPIPTTYAGGVRSMEDVERIEELGQGRLDFTVGSALDLFGGKGLRYEELVAFNQLQKDRTQG